jgi:hypothetical protein
MSVGRSPAPTSASPDKEGSFAPRLAARSGLPGWFSGTSLGKRNNTLTAAENKQELDRAYDGLEKEVPDRVARAIRWLRNPKARWIRLPVGVLLIVLSFFWFLPVVGIELLPIGLLLIAVDIPFLQKPVARAVLWLERKWIDLRTWWQGRKK